MNQIWFKIFAAMLVGTLIKYIIVNWLAWIAIDLAVLAVCYFILRRYPYVDFKKTMLFLGGLTFINILVDSGIMSSMFGTLASLALVAWVMFRGGGGGRPSMRYKWHK